MFDLVNEQVTISPEVLNVPELKVIWDRDKTKGKKEAYAELCFIFYTTDFKSPYRNYPTEERFELVAKDFPRRTIDDKWKPDNTVLIGLKKYDELQTTPSLKYLESVENQIIKIKNFLDGTIIDEDTVKTIVDSIDKANKIILNLPQIKEAVKKEVSEKSKIRGGGSVGMFED